MGPCLQHRPHGPHARAELITRPSGCDSLLTNLRLTVRSLPQPVPVARSVVGIGPIGARWATRPSTTWYMPEGSGRGENATSQKRALEFRWTDDIHQLRRC